MKKIGSDGRMDVLRLSPLRPPTPGGRGRGHCVQNTHSSTSPAPPEIININFLNYLYFLYRGIVVFESLYFCNLIVQTCDISNLDYNDHSIEYLRSMTLNCKNIGIEKSVFTAKTQFL